MLRKVLKPSRKVRAKMLKHSPGRQNRIPPHLLKPSQEQSTWAFLCGAQAVHPDAYCDIDEQLSVKPTVGASVVSQPEPADQYTERQLAKSKLSDEARYVLDTIMNGPDEVMALISSPTLNRPTRKHLREWLRSLGWHRERIDSAFAELRDYMGTIT